MKTNSYIQKDDTIYNLNQKKSNQPQSIPISNLSVFKKVLILLIASIAIVVVSILVVSLTNPDKKTIFNFHHHKSNSTNYTNSSDIIDSSENVDIIGNTDNINIIYSNSEKISTTYSILEQETDINTHSASNDNKMIKKTDIENEKKENEEENEINKEKFENPKEVVDDENEEYINEIGISQNIKKEEESENEIAQTLINEIEQFETPQSISNEIEKKEEEKEEKEKNEEIEKEEKKEEKEEK